MKKSKIYEIAQLAVLQDERITDLEKLEVLYELQDRKDICLLVEERETEKEKENESA